jgi:DNA-binding beta-propeller fold protein YncE
MKWYEAASPQRVVLSGTAGALAFDGERVWVALSGRDAIAWVEPSTGAVTEINFTGFPQGMARALPFEAMVYDGENFWISGPQGGLVVRPDGTIVPQINLPSCVRGGMLFDGSRVWVDGQRFDVRPNVPGWAWNLAGGEVVACDGTYAWSAAGAQLVGIELGTGLVRVQQPLPSPVEGLVCDGTHLWMTNSGRNLVSKYARDGGLVISYPTGLSPAALLFDGAHIWVANRDGGSVTKLRASDGKQLGTFFAGPEPNALVFDGINIWVASAQAALLSRL